MQVFTKILAWIPPRTVLTNLGKKKGTALLESVKGGRYSILVANPLKIVKNLKQLEAELLRLPKLKSPLPFCGGAVGLLNYELAHEFEDFSTPSDETLPRVWFGLYDHGLVFDHRKKELTAFAWNKKQLEEIVIAIQATVEKSNPANLVNNNDNGIASANCPVGLPRNDISSNFTRHQYISAVKKIKKLIHAGYTFQVNLSQKFTLKTNNIDSIQMYDRLSRVNPAPFAGYLDAGDFQVLSSSPELLFEIIGNSIETRPLAGTRPRGETPAQDRKLEQELKKSAKENAEHIMLVDLERNDLGRICEFGSVKVSRLARVEKYARVQHLVSTATGKLQSKISLREILRALFPGGTITGCPKIETMKIISTFEQSARGPYTGSLGYISTNENTQFNILIRTLVYKDNELTWQAGGGIVADSDSTAEYAETLHKAKALFETVLND